MSVSSDLSTRRGRPKKHGSETSKTPKKIPFFKKTKFSGNNRRFSVFPTGEKTLNGGFFFEKKENNTGWTHNLQEILVQFPGGKSSRKS